MTNKRDREKLRSRVKTALERSGLTQKDLEAAEGWSAGTLSRVYSGKKHPDAEFLRALADRLGIAPIELVGGTGFAELFSSESTAEGAPDRDAVPEALPETTEESRTPAEITQESEKADGGEPETTVPSAPPVPSPALAAPPPEPVAAPVPEPAKAAAEPSPDRGPQPEWKPPPEPRKRKRDLPLRLVKWVMGLAFGDRT